MAQAFVIAMVAWTACFITTIVVSLLTKPKPDEELKGLVYSLTPQMKDGAVGFMKNPVTLGVLVLIITVVLNFILF